METENESAKQLQALLLQMKATRAAGKLFHALEHTADPVQKRKRCLSVLKEINADKLAVRATLVEKARLALTMR